MALRGKRSGLSGFGAGTRRNGVDATTLHRVEDRKRDLERATQHWVGLLREMEASGESASPNYERYYQAYLDAKHQEKQADLELFNVRRGLIS